MRVGGQGSETQDGDGHDSESEVDSSRARRRCATGVALKDRCGEIAAAVVFVACIFPTAHAAQVQHLNTQTATASGAGATGTPTIASFNIPSGKNRVLFIWPTFERDHCSNADTTGGLCTNGNVAGTGRE